MKPFSIVKFVFVCFSVAFLSACATAKAPLPPVGISNVSHGDFKYSGEYLKTFGGKRWRYGRFQSYYKRVSPEFTATVALVMAKRPEVFEGRKNSNSKFVSRCKSELNALVDSPYFPDRVQSKDEYRHLINRCFLYVLDRGASYARSRAFDFRLSDIVDNLGIRFKIIGENGGVVETFHGNFPPDKSG